MKGWVVVVAATVVVVLVVLVACSAADAPPQAVRATVAAATVRYLMFTWFRRRAEGWVSKRRSTDMFVVT